MYGTQQFAGQQVRPQQYGTIGGYYPQQTSDPFTGMFSMMMPMIMMVLMLGILTPMLKGFTTK
jgi:hypothetical protein